MMRKQILSNRFSALLISFIWIFGVLALNGRSPDDKLVIWSSPEVSDLSKTLVNLYSESNPDINIEYQHGSPDAKLIHSAKGLGFVTKEFLRNSETDDLWRLSVGRDIIIPVMNANNPLKEEICCQGISPMEFTSLYRDKLNAQKKNILGETGEISFNCYCSADEATCSYLCDFLNADKEVLNPHKVKDSEALIDKIKNDVYAIGFCRLADIFKYESHEIDPAILPIPIDLNNNNKIDYFENIYTKYNDLERGIWIGKYPRALYTDIFAISANEKLEYGQEDFLKWVLTDGQEQLAKIGFSALAFSEKQSKLEKLYASQQLAELRKENQPVKTANILLIILAGIAGLFMVFLLIARLTSRVEEEEPIKSVISSDFGENSIKVPAGIFFDKTHTWAYMEKDGYARVGIDDFIQHITGRITKIKTRSTGEKINKGEVFLTLVQDGKHIELKSPLTGKIVDINHNLLKEASLINKYPYSEGWVYAVKPVKWMVEIKSYLLGEEYITWLKNEFSRLRDFLSSSIKSRSNGKLETVMQEGGELKEGFLEHLGPEFWEEFQTGYIDKSS